MNLPSDLQRLLPYIAVAVLAVVGLVLVMRGVGTSGVRWRSRGRQIVRVTDPRQG